MAIKHDTHCDGWAPTFARPRQRFTEVIIKKLDRAHHSMRHGIIKELLIESYVPTCTVTTQDWENSHALGRLATKLHMSNYEMDRFIDNLLAS